LGPFGSVWVRLDKNARRERERERKRETDVGCRLSIVGLSAPMSAVGSASARLSARLAEAGIRELEREMGAVRSVAQAPTSAGGSQAGLRAASHRQARPPPPGRRRCWPRSGGSLTHAFCSCDNRSPWAEGGGRHRNTGRRPLGLADAQRCLCGCATPASSELELTKALQRTRAIARHCSCFCAAARLHARHIARDDFRKCITLAPASARCERLCCVFARHAWPPAQPFRRWRAHGGGQTPALPLSPQLSPSLV
jgi:hypothetical protein